MSMSHSNQTNQVNHGSDNVRLTFMMVLIQEIEYQRNQTNQKKHSSDND